MPTFIEVHEIWRRIANSFRAPADYSLDHRYHTVRNGESGESGIYGGHFNCPAQRYQRSCIHFIPGERVFAPSDFLFNEKRPMLFEIASILPQIAVRMSCA